MTLPHFQMKKPNGQLNKRKIKKKQRDNKENMRKNLKRFENLQLK